MAREARASVGIEIEVGVMDRADERVRVSSRVRVTHHEGAGDVDADVVAAEAGCVEGIDAERRSAVVADRGRRALQEADPVSPSVCSPITNR